MSDSGRTGADAAIDPLILAIDVGTSSARALVYDVKGRMVDTLEVHRQYDVHLTPDGGVEADPSLLLELVASCVDDVLAVAHRASRRIAAIACDTFWHSIIGVSADGKALTPVYTWADTRSRHAARELRGRVDEAAVHARTGAVIHSSYPPAKLLWLSQSQPDLMKTVAYWMSFGEYLYLQLFGELRVSVSMASGTGLFDQNSCIWDEELLSVLPIKEGQLSPICEFSDAMTHLRDPYASRWTGIHDVPWYLPLGDGACNNVGSGGCDDRWGVVMIGTSGAIRVTRTGSHVDLPPDLWTYRVDRRRLVQGGALSDGGNVFAWLERTLRLDASPDIDRELFAMPPDGHGLTMLPFLAGERSPNWNVDARAAIVGMTLDSRPLDIARAALEAVAYRFGVIHDGLKRAIPGLQGIIGSGAGLLHSPAWMQIMTDVLGEPMVTSAVPEATSRGAALLALEAMGTIADIGDLPAPLGERHVPSEDNHSIYRAAMTRQEDLYSSLLGSPWTSTTSTRANGG